MPLFQGNLLLTSRISKAYPMKARSFLLLLSFACIDYLSNTNQTSDKSGLSPIARCNHSLLCSQWLYLFSPFVMHCTKEFVSVMGARLWHLHVPDASNTLPVLLEKINDSNGFVGSTLYTTYGSSAWTTWMMICLCSPPDPWVLIQVCSGGLLVGRISNASSIYI